MVGNISRAEQKRKYHKHRKNNPDKTDSLVYHKTLEKDANHVGTNFSGWTMDAIRVHNLSLLLRHFHGVSKVYWRNRLQN